MLRLAFFLSVFFSIIFSIVFAPTLWADTNSSNSLAAQLGIPIDNTSQTQPQPLSASQAFVLKTEVSPGLVNLDFNIAPGYALYKNRFEFVLLKNAINPDFSNISVGEVNFPKGFIHEDPVFGKQIEYSGLVHLIIPINGPVISTDQLDIAYQGCSAQMCYPVQHQIINLAANPQEIQNPKANTTGIFSILLSLSGLFVLGILLAFTPCILPLVPILSGIILGQKKKTVLNGLIMAMSYVLGMAIAYACLGYLITRLGASFQGIFETPWVILVVVLILILMACSMFGFYSLQLPLGIRHWVNIVDRKLKGGSVISVFLMGAVSILVISPCASAPLIAVLSLMIQTGDSLMGAVSLFILALGMGVPLILISVGLGKFLPKTGAWMQIVRRLIGVLMLLVAVYLLFRLIPMSWREHPMIKVSSLPVLESTLKTSKPPVVLDFYANWCVECHDLARTMNSPKLAPLLKNITLIQVDVSADNADSEALMNQYHILGLPTLIFLDNQDQESDRLAGSLSLQELQKALKKESRVL